ncbi:MAG: transglutaminase domain-containing protein, partial [Oscillospiraceae bacterium]|nr:transglutaminase domain-containing protein [Oscillospiraceae bacterium]
MKWLKKGLFLLIVISVVTVIAGCTIWQDAAPEEPVPTKDPVEEAYKKDPASFVEFSRSTEPRQKFVSVQELLEYESQYADCNSTWFRDQLSGEDLVIYNSYLYALENRFIYFNMYVEDNDKDFSYIREMVSLDSPFLEQNYSDYEYTWKRPTNYIGEQIRFSMEQFTDSRWKMKMEALNKCRQIVENIPKKCSTQRAKMEYLYDYVCDNVEYVDYESMVDESYFYDAVCKGETVCDGYSNMLLILFRLIGVECCEVMANGEEGQDGHTWVVAKLNDLFYNFDPTYEDTDEVKSDKRRYFGFSDQLVSMKTLEYEDMRPKCTDTSRDFNYADIVVSSFTDKSAVKEIAALAEKRLANGKKKTLVGVKGSVQEKEYDRFFDRFFVYAKKSKKISISVSNMRNGTLV